MVGDAYGNAPVTNPDDCRGSTCISTSAVITVSALSVTDADPYLVPRRLARGGESIKEVACVPGGNVETCQFPTTRAR